jgi:predicted transcriptional regulator
MRAVRAKLSPELVLEMFELRAAGWTQQSLGDRFGVNNSTVSRALTGKRWSEVRAGIKNPPPILSRAEATRAANAKLTAHQVRRVHRMAAEGMTRGAIAATVSVTRPAVGYILRGETFRDIWLEFNTPKVRKGRAKRGPYRG